MSEGLTRAGLMLAMLAMMAMQDGCETPEEGLAWALEKGYASRMSAVITGSTVVARAPGTDEAYVVTWSGEQAIHEFIHRGMR